MVDAIKEKFKFLLQNRGILKESGERGLKEANQESEQFEKKVLIVAKDVDLEQHQAHRSYIESRIKREQKKIDEYDSVRKSIFECIIRSN